MIVYIVFVKGCPTCLQLSRVSPADRLEQHSHRSLSPSVVRWLNKRHMLTFRWETTPLTVRLSSVDVT